MRTIEFKKSFDKTFRNLQPQDQQRVEEIIDLFLGMLEKGELPKGIGLKRLKEDIWEIRINLHIRVGFRMHNSLIEFGIVGNHDDIKRYLKNL